MEAARVGAFAALADGPATAEEVGDALRHRPRERPRSC